MLSKSNLKKVIFILLIILYSIQLSKAETYAVSPAGASDQKIINAAINAASPGDTVYLNSGVYDVANTITMKSYIKLTGDQNAILRVSASSQWFINGVVVCNEAIHDIEIYGFQCDGNIGNLPREWDSTPGHDRDAGKFFLLGGYSNQMSRNIKIHDMKIHSCFSDGIYLKYTDGIELYNNEIINCQHEGYFISACKNADVYNNKISGICSDGGRFMNSIFYKVRNNIFISFSGNSFGAFKGGEAGLQIGDQVNEVNHGFAPSYKPFLTDNAEVTGNIFGYSSEKAIHIVNIQDTANIIINSNTYLDKGQLERAGIDFDLNYSANNPPSVEDSERIFSNIFDILDSKVTDTGRTNQTADDIPLQVATNESGIIAGGVIIVGVRDKIILDNASYIPDESAVLVQGKVIQNPNYEQFVGIIKDIDKNITVKIKNNTAYATLNVKTEWSTIKTDPKTGKNSIKGLKTAKNVFSDSYYPVPNVLKRELTAKACVNVYNDSKNPVTKLRVPYTNTTQRIEYTYGENTTVHKLMLGERVTDDKGLQYTAYTRCNIFEGNISHMGNELIIYGDFDPAKLHIKYYTPYESSEVTDIEIIYHKNEGEESQLMIVLKFISYLLFAMIAGYKIMEIAI
jgi:hypothetical protein